MVPLIYLSLGYAFSELLLLFVKRSDRRAARTREDKGSLALLWIMITLGFTGGFMLSKPVNYFWAGFGFPFIIGGLIVRWIAIFQLGKAFTVDVAITETAKLKTDGIYENIRHPSYSGMLLIVTGFGTTMSSLSSFLILVIPVLIAVIYRISVEEKVLVNAYGKDYLDYKSRTKRLIPRIY